MNDRLRSTLQERMRDRMRALAPAAGASATTAPAGERRLRVQAAAGDEATLYIYADVGSWYGVEADIVVRELAALSASVIHVRINSNGGDVFDGLTIYNALKRHPARKIVHVDGLAASIASVIAMAGDEIRMHDGSFMMIHDPWVCCCGSAADLREVALMLEEVEESIAAIYSKRSGMPVDEVREVMHATTWYSATKAREAGFADATDDTPAAQANGDLSIFANVPDALRGAGARVPNNARDFAAFLTREGGFPQDLAGRIAASAFPTTTSTSTSTSTTTTGQAGDSAGDGDLDSLAALLRSRGAALNQLTSNPTR